MSNNIISRTRTISVWRFTLSSSSAVRLQCYPSRISPEIPCYWIRMLYSWKLFSWKPWSLLNEGTSREGDDSEKRRGERPKSGSASNSVVQREVSITTLHRGLIVYLIFTPQPGLLQAAFRSMPILWPTSSRFLSGKLIVSCGRTCTILATL